MLSCRRYRIRAGETSVVIVVAFTMSAMVTLQFTAQLEMRRLQQQQDALLTQPRAVTSRISTLDRWASKSKTRPPPPPPALRYSVTDSATLNNDGSDSMEDYSSDYAVDAVTEQVATCLDDDPSLNLTNVSKFSHYLTANGSGGIGSLMFRYASLLGMARDNHMTPVIPQHHKLLDIFELSKASPYDGALASWHNFEEDYALSYDVRTQNLNYGIDIKLVGHYQSFKYFETIYATLHNEFTFKRSIVDVATSFLSSAVDKFEASRLSKQSVITVALHYRRGNLLAAEQQQRGYTVATLDYVDTAMSYYLAKYSPEALLFVVCSDEPDFIRHKLSAMFITRRVTVVYADVTSFELELASVPALADISRAEVQLCLLSLCDHSIITTGAFSWWAGWLANGTVLYYAGFPRPYSALDDQFLPSDYYPPHWIGIG